MTLSVIIPFWSFGPDADAMLAECRASLGPVHETILVVNEPTPDGCSLFAKHLNLGLRLATGDYLACVTSDTRLELGTLADLCQPDAITSPVVNGLALPFWGCFFVLPRAIYAAHGGFDEAFTGYYEDSDYACRMYQAGVPLRSVPAVDVAHIGGASVKRLNVEKMQADNRARFVARWGREVSMFDLAAGVRL